MRAMRETARSLLARLGAESRCRCAAAPFRHRPAPDRRHCPRAGGRGQGHLHGRADLVADAVGNRQAARHRAHAVGRRHCHRLRQPSPCGGAGDFEPRHGAARRQAGRRLSHCRHDAVATYRAHDRQDFRPERAHQGPRAFAGRAPGRRPDVAPATTRTSR